jgi:hypothetical protein
VNSISIVIPTILKPGVLNTVKSALNITRGTSILIEVVINPLHASSSAFKEVEKKLLEIPGILIRYHEQIHVSAESSAMYACESSSSEWIWILGDEDIPTAAAVPHLLNLAEDINSNFFLLNAGWIFNSNPISFYQVGPDEIQIATAEQFFNKLGFISITPALSCWFIRKSIINLKKFEEFHSVFEIYSHTFALMSFLYPGKVGISNTVCVLRKEGNAHEIANSLASVTTGKKLHVSTIWIEGLLALASRLSIETGIDLRKILDSREIEMVKKDKIVEQKDLQVLVSTTLGVIQRAYQVRVLTKGIRNDFNSGIFPNYAEWRSLLREETPSLLYPAPVRIGLRQ